MSALLSSGSSVKVPRGDAIATPSPSTTVAPTSAVCVLLVSTSENATVPLTIRLAVPSPAAPSAISVTDTAASVPTASITGSSFVPVIITVTSLVTVPPFPSSA